MKERSFDEFDEFANEYRSIHSENIKISGADSFYFAEIKVKLLTAFENNTSINVLDIGCGDGVTQMFMLKYFSNWIITGIDVSEKSIEAALERKLPGVFFSTYNGTQTNFHDGTFDIIFMAGVLHHVDYSLHQTILKEVYRILKNQGRFYIFEHNPLNPLTRYLVNTCVFDKDARLLKSSYTIKILKYLNFIRIKNIFIIFFPRKGFLSKLIFLEKYLQWLPFGGQYILRAKK